MLRPRSALLAIVAIAGVPALVLAQDGRIVGTVSAAEGGEPIANAQVRAVGTTSGALTREDGRYILLVRPGTYTVRVNRLGYAPDSVTGVVVAPGAEVSANFSLKPSAAVLSSVRIIGYGQQQEKDRTGVVATVTTEDFNTGRIVAPEELLRGKVAGVQVVDNNEPGAGVAVRVRGGTSIGASNDPLYVVDGVPLTVGGGASAGRNPLNFLNPADIASITVLKDASSTAIYGSRGANGVVIITTRTGVTGPSFTYSSTFSTSKVTGGPDMLSADQYRTAVQEHSPASVQAVILDANTDWMKAIEQDGTGIEQNLGFSSRRGDAAYHVGLGWLDQTGVVRGTKTQRASLSFNYDDKLFTDRLNLRARIKGTRTKDAFTPGNVLGNAISMAASQPIRNADGTWFQWGNPLGANNPLSDLAQIQDNGTTLRSLGNLEGEYTLPWISGLTATVRGGYDIVRADRTTFTPTTAQSQLEGSANTRGNFYRNIPEQQNTVFDAFSKYERDVPALSSRFDVTAGYSAERFRGDYPSIYAEGLSTDLLGPSGIPTAVAQRPQYTVDEYSLVSGFGRANWSLLDRYLFTATVRRDGSSRFAEGNQYGTFPSAAFAWRPLEESWLEDRLPFSDLKLRVSWGVNGNQAVGNYIAYTAYTYGQPTAQQQLGQVFVPTIRPSASNPDLKWETTKSTNVGIDFGILDDRVTGSIEGYTKRTDDLLISVPTAAGMALSNFITTNLGSVQNRGFELTVDWRVFDRGSKGLRWNANFNASTNRNKLLTLNRPGLSFIQTGDVSGGTGTRVQVFQPGHAVNSFFVYEHIRENGKPVYRDRDGNGSINDLDLYVDRNDDGVINTADLRPFHDPAPKWILGHTSNVSWRGFDASTTIRAYLGNYVYNNVASNLGTYAAIMTTAPGNLHASVLENGFAERQLLSDVYVEKASFLRMDNLTLGYTFDRIAQLQKPRIFGTIQNVFTSTEYSGVDPTAGVNGLDNNLYPRSRTFLGGLSVNF